MCEGDETGVVLGGVTVCPSQRGHIVWSGCSPVTQNTGDRGSGTLMGVAILASVVIVGSFAIAIANGLSEARSVQVAANQAALAASDVSRGVVPGHPCRVASALVSEAGYRLSGCDVAEGKAWIAVTRTWWGMAIEKRAHAGPAEHPVFREGP